ncbi:MAG: glucans biosynthesis glucosyltransferase MdoH [Candidatus Omnitrophica bacterium]|nr:glucans biosynthesis glucosyltransferase MdoH [Candidatus Omnitrophota bacterium]
MINSHRQPPLHRSSMSHRPFVPPILSKAQRRLVFVLALRRGVFFILVAASMYVAGMSFATILSADGSSPLTRTIIGIFICLFGWLSFNFWTIVFGFITALRKVDNELPLPHEIKSISPQTRTAIIMPVYNEEMSRIYSALRATYQSLEETGQLAQFDFFILSDSVDNHSILMEETAWMDLCRDVNGFGKIFYRRRKVRLHKKSGNVSDFCRRWGSEYKYMIIFDADSLMEGELLVRMVNVMEERADIGILQTAPMAVNQVTLVSRLQQFASHVYGPLFFAGLRFWQMDESGYWGHNAIVRMEPFMKYCALPHFSGRPPFGGEILSHDFVEAALMRRAGWGVWLAYELEGSYEELPPSLFEELERDKRWCQGNIQHLRLMFMKGARFGHRLLFLNGNLFYFSSFLLLLLLGLMTAYAVGRFFHTVVYFSGERVLFPHWPVLYSELSIRLLMVTFAFLLIPKLLSVLLIIISPSKVVRFGGGIRLCLSVIIESIFSMILAPLRMIFHAWYVVLNLVMPRLAWKPQVRHAKKTSFAQAFGAYWLSMLGALLWAMIAYAVNKTLFWWVSMMVLPLVFAVPISVLFSLPSLGMFFRKCGLLLTPPETQPSRVLSLYHSRTASA